MRLETFLLEPPRREGTGFERTDDQVGLSDTADPEALEETDPSVDATLAAAREKLSATLAEHERLARNLLSLQKAFATKAETILDRWARALGESARAALPSVLSEGSTAEIAEAARAIVGAGPSAAITIRTAPSQRAMVAALLECPGAEVEVRADATLADGSMALDWEDGGATIDAEPLAWAALDILNHQLERLRAKETLDDRR